VTLADTPTTWPEGPSISTLHSIAVFAGIPLLVIVVISLLVYAPSWVHGPRYRPGQPWDSKSEWFGVSPVAEPTAGLLEPSGDTEALARTTAVADDDPDAVERRGTDAGGASAGW
jgi:hypothetical protein